MAVVETLKQGPAEAPHTAVIPQSDRQGLHSLQVTFLPVTLSWLSLQGIASLNQSTYPLSRST